MTRAAPPADGRERARVEADIAAPAAAVWDIFRWENLEAASASGLFAGVDYDERRPIVGATRVVRLAEGGDVRERLLSVDAAGFGLDYEVLNLADFPLAFYRGRVAVSPLADGRSHLVFACEFEPKGITADEWRSLYAGMQQHFIAYVRARLEPAQGEN